MPEFDFKDVGTVIGVVIGAAGLEKFKEVFGKPGTLASEIREALDDPAQPGPGWVRSQRSALAKALLSPARLFLSLFYLVIIVGFVYIVWVGPERLLSPASFGPLAERLKGGEQLLYLIMATPVVVLYLLRVAISAWSGWRTLWRATRWLWKEDR